MPDLGQLETSTSKDGLMDEPTKRRAIRTVALILTDPELVAMRRGDIGGPWPDPEAEEQAAEIVAALLDPSDAPMLPAAGIEYRVWLKGNEFPIRLSYAGVQEWALTPEHVDRVECRNIGPWRPTMQSIFGARG